MAKPDPERLDAITQEANRLFHAGSLTLEKLDELERQAEEAAGDSPEEWREGFVRYREVVEVFGDPEPDH